MKTKRLIIILIFLVILINISLFIYFLLDDDKEDNNQITINPDIVNQEKIFLKLIPDIKKDLIEQKIDFVEINLSEMKARLFNSGEVGFEFPIIARGDLDSWGGTASGLYSVLSKTKVAWSGAADVYMPYAIQFYGKYYIHGEPYYPNGSKMVSDYSGGCIRLSDEDVKKLYSLVKKDMPVLVIDKEKDDYQYSSRKLSNLPNIDAASFLVADLDNGFVIAQKEMNKVMPIASLTKLMTTIVVAENINLEKYITIDKQILEEGYGATTNLILGESYRIVELFYPLLIESSNDSAFALASYLGKKTTIARMNKKAEMILMKDTQFADVSGYDPGNVSNATDLFQITRYITNVRPLIWNITKGEKVLAFGYNRFLDTNFWNKNIFYLDETLVGGKTGFIKASKSTGVFVFKILDKDNQERHITFILLGSNYLKKDVQKLYNWTFKNYFSY